MKPDILWHSYDLRIASDVPDGLIPLYFPYERLGGVTRSGIERSSPVKAAALHSWLRCLIADLGYPLQLRNGPALSWFRENRDAVGVVYTRPPFAPDESNAISKLISEGLDIRFLPWDGLVPFTGKIPFMYSDFRRMNAHLMVKSPSDPEATVRFKTDGILPGRPYILPGLTAEAGLTDILNPDKVLAHFLNHVRRNYADTRNEISGQGGSRLSMSLALGSITARRIVKTLAGDPSARDSDDQMIQELLWREFFRHSLRIHGSSSFRHSGFRKRSAHQAWPLPDENFLSWSCGNTGEPLIDAGMRQLKLTGHLSNRMRQIVASFWIHEMSGDWRMGMDWFESRLADFDVATNTGNWAYIAGAGHDPRGGRHFDIEKQAKIYDADGQYREAYAGITG